MRVLGNGFGEAYIVPRYMLPKDGAKMHVPAKVRRSVIFIGSVDGDGAFTPKATGFLVITHSTGDDSGFPCLVTAEHVVSGMLTKGMEIHCRLNLRNGEAKVTSLKDAQWWFHPNAPVDPTDVAVATLGVNTIQADHDYMPLFEYPLQNQNILAKDHKLPGLGDEIFIVGLFKSHYGKQRNRPIIRIGNVAAMPEEPVYTKYCGYIDAYLIETRSISGLSGSPVFVNDPGWPGGVIPGMIADPRFKSDPEEVIWGRYHFLGLMHGHFDLENIVEDSILDDAMDPKGINSGIGVVVPAQKVLETLYQPELKALRQKTQTQQRGKTGATADLDLSESASSKEADDANPNHLADFTRLVDVAARKRPQGDQT